MAFGILLDLLRVNNGNEKLSESFYAMKKIIGDLDSPTRKFMHTGMIICFIGMRTAT